MVDPDLRRHLRAARPLPRLVLAPPAGRLPRDRHALLRPGVRRASRTPTDPYGITNGSNGLANVDPLTFFGGHVTIHTTRGYYWFLLGVVAVAAHRPLLPQRVADRPRLEGVARGPALGRDDGHARQPAEDHGVQLRRRRSRASPAASSPPCRRARSRENFGTAVLILIYAVVILGGTGSLTGMIDRRHRDHLDEPGARLDVAAEPGADALLHRADRRRSCSR